MKQTILKWNSEMIRTGFNCLWMRFYSRHSRSDTRGLVTENKRYRSLYPLHPRHTGAWRLHASQTCRRSCRTITANMKAVTLPVALLACLTY